MVVWLSLVFSCVAQAQEKFWLNVPDSPVVIDTDSTKRHTELINYAPKDIVRYRCGCVVLDGEKITQLATFDEKEASIAGRISADDSLSFTLLDVSQAEIRKCKNKNAKVAVVEVSFVSGGRWRIGDPLPK